MVAVRPLPLRKIEDAEPSSKASPFVKWAGGKRRLMSQYEAFLPKSFTGYHEPFLGGGAFFFHLQPKKAVLSDINYRLIESYEAIRDDLSGVLECLHYHRRNHSKTHYYRCRELLNKGDLLIKSDRAALMIYLNKTCFNGLYRENLKGDFNVPIGRYKNPAIYDRANLFSVHEKLQGIDIRHEGFEGVLFRARPGDLVYFDPPSVPISETSSFTNYSKDGFGAAKQRQLAEVYKKLAERGCQVMLSNSDCGFVRELYSDFRIEVVQAARSINSRAAKRGAINEVLVMSW